MQIPENIMAKYLRLLAHKNSPVKNFLSDVATSNLRMSDQVRKHQSSVSNRKKYSVRPDKDTAYTVFAIQNQAYLKVCKLFF